MEANIATEGADGALQPAAHLPRRLAPQEHVPQTRPGQEPEKISRSCRCGRRGWACRASRKINLLNYVPYSKKEAMETLSREFGWEYYGGKHFESRFTKYFQSVYLPRKFGYDKRRAHLSCLILNGEMTREEALAELAKPPYPVEQQKEDEELHPQEAGRSTRRNGRDILDAPPTPDSAYFSQMGLLRLAQKILGKEQAGKHP